MEYLRKWGRAVPKNISYVYRVSEWVSEGGFLGKILES